MKHVCIILLLSLLMPLSNANAKHRHNNYDTYGYNYNYYGNYGYNYQPRNYPIPSHGYNYQPRNYPIPSYGLNLSRIVVASGHKITVASHLASRWKALIDDFVVAGYKPRNIGCFTTSGHVPHSRHYAGAACDFDQRGWGLTVPFMYRAHKIIVKHGFRDGCDFNDCGHVDDGLPLHRHGSLHRHRHRQRNNHHLQ
jgi:hypothetical protein